jgi:hypothetical protein
MPSVLKATRTRFFLMLLSFIAVPFVASAGGDGARVVKYSKEDVVPVHAKLRFSTLIVLPEEEEILDFTTGDREFWIINGSHNLCYVHPAQAGIRSNLNLITASGHVYSFLLTEISSEPNVQPDLKLFVEPKEGSSSGVASRGYVRAADADAYRKELESVRLHAAEQVRAAEAHAAEEINQFRSAHATKPVSTTRWTRRLPASRFSSPLSITTTLSPTSGVTHAKSPRSMKSRTANRISSPSRWRTAFTSLPKSSTPVISPLARRS